MRVERFGYADREIVTFDELDEFSQALQRFIVKIKKIEAEPHHAHEWGETSPTLVEQITRAAIKAFDDGGIMNAQQAVRVILEREVR